MRHLVQACRDIAGKRSTDPQDLRLVPIEKLSREDRQTSFELDPPWLRKVYRDPNDRGRQSLDPGPSRSLWQRYLKWREEAAKESGIAMN